MLQLQGSRGDDVYAYEKSYVNFILLSILNSSIISFMMNILSHCHNMIGFLASEFLWLCSCCLGDDMVHYMHVQGAHSLEMTHYIFLYTLGWLRNEVMECKHSEMKILNRNQGGGRGVHKENRSTFEHDRMSLLNNMGANFFKLVMISKVTFQKFFPSNIRSQLHVEYEKSINQLNKETATQLAS